VLPNDSWSSAGSVAYAGENVVDVDGQATLIGYVGDEGGVAVVSADLTVPFEGSVSMQNMAASMGVPIPAVGFPEGSDPIFTYDGKTTLTMKARIDTAKGDVLQSYSTGSTEYTVSVEGWPTEMGDAPLPGIEVAASFSLNLKKQELGAAPPKEEGGQGAEEPSIKVKPSPSREASPSP
jgi:hypothetical protein